MLEYYRYKEVSELYAQNRVEEARHLLMELQARYIGVCDENSTLRVRLQEFEDVLHMANNLVYDGFYYWLMTGSIKQGPFCTGCYDREGALIRLDRAEHEWVCPVCGSSYERITVLPREPRRAPRTAKIIPFAR